jgi:hypothetical protein
MADTNTILESLTASNIFDLRGVVAVVTGGGTVCVCLWHSEELTEFLVR